MNSQFSEENKNMSNYLDFSLHAASQPAAINADMQVSTGTTSAFTSPPHIKTLKTPERTAAVDPFGPYKLSVHPGIGSLYVDKTGKKRNIIQGNLSKEIVFETIL